MQAGVYSGLTGGYLSLGVGYARLGLPAHTTCRPLPPASRGVPRLPALPTAGLVRRTGICVYLYLAPCVHYRRLRPCFLAPSGRAWNHKQRSRISTVQYMTWCFSSLFFALRLRSLSGLSCRRRCYKNSTFDVLISCFEPFFRAPASTSGLRLRPSGLCLPSRALQSALTSISGLSRAAPVIVIK